MGNCDLCGQEKELYKAIIEGVELNVCSTCGRHGNVIERITTEEPNKRKFPSNIVVEDGPETVELVVGNYAQIIKRGREKKGLKQKEFAKLLHEKESIIHNIETGKFEPSMGLAKKIGRFLNVELVKEHTEKKYDPGQKGEKGEMTLGDYINIKRKK